MLDHTRAAPQKVRVLFALFFVAIAFLAAADEEADVLGRRGGSFLSTTGSFTLSSGNRAGNSERTVLGDDDHDHSIEEIMMPTDTTEAEAHERVKEVFAKKRSTTQGNGKTTVLDDSAHFPTSLGATSQEAFMTAPSEERELRSGPSKTTSQEVHTAKEKTIEIKLLVQALTRKAKDKDTGKKKGNTQGSKKSLNAVAHSSATSKETCSNHPIDSLSNNVIDSSTALSNVTKAQFSSCKTTSHTGKRQIEAVDFEFPPRCSKWEDRIMASRMSYKGCYGSKHEAVLKLHTQYKSTSIRMHECAFQCWRFEFDYAAINQTMCLCTNQSAVEKLSKPTGLSCGCPTWNTTSNTEARRGNAGPYTYKGQGVAGPQEIWNIGNAHGKGVEACFQAVVADSRCTKDYFTYVARGDKKCGCQGISAKGQGSLTIRSDSNSDYYKIISGVCLYKVKSLVEPLGAPGLVKLTHGICLDPNRRNEKGGKVHLSNCDPENKNQQWTYTASNKQLKATHGKCLNANQRNKNGGKVHLSNCDPNNKNQQWTYTASNKQLKATDGKCLDASQRNKRGSKVHMWSCNPNNKNQQWDIPSVPTPQALSVNWTRCASEGQQCYFNGTSMVRYGCDPPDSHWQWRTVASNLDIGVTCGKKLFGRLPADVCSASQIECWVASVPGETVLKIEEQERPNITKVTGYEATIGKCHGGPTWPSGALWQCQEQPIQEHLCASLCTDQGECGAYNTIPGTPADSLQDCCLFKARSAGSGNQTGHNCMVKKTPVSKKQTNETAHRGWQHDGEGMQKAQERDPELELGEAQGWGPARRRQAFTHPGSKGRSKGKGRSEGKPSRHRYFRRRRTLPPYQTAITPRKLLQEIAKHAVSNCQVQRLEKMQAGQETRMKCMGPHQEAPGSPAPVGLNSIWAWYASAKYGSWLQVDFGSLRMVRAIAVQGNGGCRGIRGNPCSAGDLSKLPCCYRMPMYVKTYSLGITQDAINWMPVEKRPGEALLVRTGLTLPTLPKNADGKSTAESCKIYCNQVSMACYGPDCSMDKVLGRRYCDRNMDLKHKCSCHKPPAKRSEASMNKTVDLGDASGVEQRDQHLAKTEAGCAKPSYTKAGHVGKCLGTKHHRFKGGCDDKCCKALCNKNPSCGGYAVSKSNNCLYWLGCNLKPGGHDWGGCKCQLKAAACCVGAPKKKCGEKKGPRLPTSREGSLKKLMKEQKAFYKRCQGRITQEQYCMRPKSHLKSRKVDLGDTSGVSNRRRRRRRRRRSRRRKTNTKGRVSGRRGRRRRRHRRHRHRRHRHRRHRHRRHRHRRKTRTKDGTKNADKGCTSGLKNAGKHCRVQCTGPPYSQCKASSVHAGDAIGHSHGTGRLDSQQGWSAGKNQAGQWWQMDLGNVQKVVGVVTQGRKGHNQYVKSYKVQTSQDGSSWPYVDGGKIFTANTAGNNVKVGNQFASPIIARFVRIVVQTWNIHISMRAAALVCGPIKVSFKQAGERGYLHDAGRSFGARNGYEYGWKCDNSPKDQSVGVRNWGNHFDLNNVCKGTTSWQIKVPNGEYKMKAILPKESHAGCKVQGQSTGGGDGNFEYKKRIKVTDGTVSVSGDFPACHSIASVELTPTGGAREKKSAGKMRMPLQSHAVFPLMPFVARSVKLYPRTWEGNVPSMRVNMFGNKCIECADAALGLASRFVLDTQLIASSTQGHSRHASDARLYGRTAWNSAKYFDCLGNSADCWLYMKPCKDIKLCEKHPMSSLPLYQSVAEGRHQLMFVQKKENKVTAKQLIVHWDLAWDEKQSTWTVPSRSRRAVPPLLMFDDTNSNFWEICLSDASRAFTHYNADDVLAFQPHSDWTAPHSSWKSAANIIKNMQNKTTPDDKRIAQFQEDINMARMEALRQIPTLKAKGILPPEDYSRQYLQISLCKGQGCKMPTVVAIATQGDPSKERSFITRYSISYSEDGKSWRFYNEQGSTSLLGGAQQFSGNTGAHGVVKHYFAQSIKARMVRLHPTCWSGNAHAVRLEVYVCETKFSWGAIRSLLQKSAASPSCETLMSAADISFSQWSLGKEGSGVPFRTPTVLIKGKTAQFSLTAYQKIMLREEGRLIKRLLCHRQVGSKSAEKCCVGKSTQKTSENVAWTSQMIDTKLL